jgi:hypothetical protein
MALAANRLDRYRELLERSVVIVGEESLWQDEADLMADIQEAIK